jgi:hypothetical protein
MHSGAIGSRGENLAFVFQKNMDDDYIPPRQEGRTRGRHDTRGGDAMDVSARSASDAPTNDADADAKSCGPGLPVLRSRFTMLFNGRPR